MRVKEGEALETQNGQRWERAGEAREEGSEGEEDAAGGASDGVRM